MASCIVWQIPFIRLSRPLALLTGFVSCKIQIKRWFLWIRRPVRPCNCSKALHHVRRQEITIVICCLDVLYRWFRNLRYDHIWFGGDKPIKDNLDKAKFFGPNILKTTLCLALVIMSLLSSTGRDCIVYRDMISQLSLRMALDLFDGEEMLDVVIEENK